MPVINFSFEPGLMNDFIDFGYEVYRGDSNWIPPARNSLARQLRADFPFYRKDGNQHRKFIAEAGGKVCGRIAAMINSDLKTGGGEQIGTLGFFECVNDHHVARDLIAASLQWLVGEMGVSHIWGPMNFDIWHGYRFMTKGFDRDLFCGEPYNKPYYPEFFERLGFDPLYRWDSLELEGRENLEKILPRGRKRYTGLTDKGYRFENFERGKYKENIRKLHTLLIRSFHKFPGFTPISYEEFSRLCSGMRFAMDPELATFVYNEKGESIGFIIAILELAGAVRATGGKKDPLSLLKFLKMSRRVDRINFHLGGATPEEISRGNGLGRAGFYYILNQALGLGFERILLTLRLAGNPARSMAGPGTPDPQREYALYGLNCGKTSDESENGTVSH